MWKDKLTSGKSFTDKTKAVRDCALVASHVVPCSVCLHLHAILERSKLCWWCDSDNYGDDDDITGQNGVHLVREISPWSSQVLCIGLAQNLKPILSDDKYWNINPNISAFGMWLICDNTWMYNIQAYAWMYHIQAFAWPQIWPNPIPNPIHGCNTFKIFEHMYALKYQQIWPNPISNPIHGLAIIKF